MLAIIAQRSTLHCQAHGGLLLDVINNTNDNPTDETSEARRFLRRSRAHLSLQLKIFAANILDEVKCPAHS